MVQVHLFLLLLTTTFTIDSFKEIICMCFSHNLQWRQKICLKIFIFSPHDVLWIFGGYLQGGRRFALLQYFFSLEIFFNGRNNNFPCCSSFSTSYWASVASVLSDHSTSLHSSLDGFISLKSDHKHAHLTFIPNSNNSVLEKWRKEKAK